MFVAGQPAEWSHLHYKHKNVGPSCRKKRPRRKVPDLRFSYFQQPVVVAIQKRQSYQDTIYCWRSVFFFRNGYREVFGSRNLRGFRVAYQGRLAVQNAGKKAENRKQETRKERTKWGVMNLFIETAYHLLITIIITNHYKSLNEHRYINHKSTI